MGGRGCFTMLRLKIYWTGFYKGFLTIFITLVTHITQNHLIMSYKHWYMQRSKEKSESGNLPSGAEKEDSFRFSDIREVDRRRHEVLDYLMLGYEADRIAHMLGENKRTIEEDINEIMKIGYEVREEDLDYIRDEIVRMHRLSARESIKAWHDSKRPQKIVKVKSYTDEFGNPKEEVVETTKTSSGDSRHLKNFTESAKELGKVTGAQKHKELEITQKNEHNQLNILNPNATQLPDALDAWTTRPDGDKTDLEIDEK